MNKILALLVVAMLCSTPVLAQDETELAKKLANPVASLISVPIQANYDANYGLDEDGSIWRINIQPVAPFSLNEKWNLITRTIVPIIIQNDVPSSGKNASGLGDIVQSFFFSPATPTSGGLIWAVGPVFLYPSATDPALGGEKWGIGPTALVLKQQGQWTLGGLVNHIFSVAGKDDRNKVSATFLQPFVSYITKNKTSYGLNTETVYDWENEAWLIPLAFNVSQMLRVGTQILQFGGGIRYWVESPEGGPQEWGGRINLTLLFPK